LTDFQGNESKKNQSGQLKKTEISKTTNSQPFWPTFYGLVLGLVVLIDAKGIDVVQSIWL
jgi:hypothetical protein